LSPSQDTNLFLDCVGVANLHLDARHWRLIAGDRDALQVEYAAVPACPFTVYRAPQSSSQFLVIGVQRIETVNLVVFLTMVAL